MAAALTVPVLTDGVVLLRPPQAADVDAVFAACQDPEVSRYTSIPAPYERHHAADWIAAAPEKWRSGAAASRLVTSAATGELLGSCGLVDITDDRAEIGYWVCREARGRGVATRATLLVTAWALGDLGLSLIDLQADVRNLASQRVAEKAGYTRVGEVDPPPRCAGRCGRMVRFVRRAGGR